MTSHFLNSDDLTSAVPEDFVALLSTVSDVAVITDREGKILEVVWNLEVVNDFDPQALKGVAMVDVVTEESRSKIREMLEFGSGGAGSRWREINHIFDGIGEFPVRYQTVPVGGSLIFLGHEMRTVAALQSRLIDAQRALEEDYGRQRQLETRYRVLFQTSQEPLLIVDAASRKVSEANGAAGRLLETEPADLVNASFEHVFSTASRVEIAEMLDRVTSTGASETVAVKTAIYDRPVECQATVFRAADAMLLLCRLSTGDATISDESQVDEMLLGMVGRIPDAMVLTDDDGRIVWCNDAFLSLSEIALAAQANGQPLSRFLGRPGADLDIIIGNAREHGKLRAFSAVLTGVFGSSTRVEISVAVLPEAEPGIVGFVMRDITRFDQIPARADSGTGEAVENMMHLVGTVPLKELVRASTEEIEKMCIEAALQKTGNNRASAAEMLGLSRQSLYVKLRRFGLLDPNG